MNTVVPKKRLPQSPASTLGTVVGDAGDGTQGLHIRQVTPRLSHTFDNGRSEPGCSLTL